MQACVNRMPDLHKKELLSAQKSTISHSADAHRWLSSQFHRISCSPLEVFNLHTYKGPGFFRWPSFFTRNNFLQICAILHNTTLFCRHRAPISNSAVAADFCALDSCSPLEVFDLQTIRPRRNPAAFFFAKHAAWKRGAFARERNSQCILAWLSQRRELYIDFYRYIDRQHQI